MWSFECALAHRDLTVGRFSVHSQPGIQLYCRYLQMGRFADCITLKCRIPWNHRKKWHGFAPSTSPLKACLHWTFFSLFCSVHDCRDNILVTSTSELLTEGNWDWTVVQLLTTRRYPHVVSCHLSFNCILWPQYSLVILGIAGKERENLIKKFLP